MSPKPVDVTSLRSLNMANCIDNILLTMTLRKTTSPYSTPPGFEKNIDMYICNVLAQACKEGSTTNTMCWETHGKLWEASEKLCGSILGSFLQAIGTPLLSSVEAFGKLLASSVEAFGKPLASFGKLLRSFVEALGSFWQALGSP